MGSKNQSKEKWEDMQTDQKMKELKAVNKESVIVQDIGPLRRNHALLAGDIGKWLDTTHCRALVIRLNLLERCLSEEDTRISWLHKFAYEIVSWV